MNKDKCISYYEYCEKNGGYFDSNLGGSGEYECKCSQNYYWNIQSNICENCSNLKDKNLDKNNNCILEENKTIN